MEEIKNTILKLGKLYPEAYEIRAYSANFGRLCLGVVLEDLSQLISLGIDMGVNSENPDYLSDCMAFINNMGKDFIVYWPDIPLTNEEVPMRNVTKWEEDYV